jgi:hypothetical protein
MKNMEIGFLPSRDCVIIRSWFDKRSTELTPKAHHERIMSALKFSHVAVRPEPVEGRPGDYDAASDEGGEGGGDLGHRFRASGGWEDFGGR